MSPELITVVIAVISVGVAIVGAIFAGFWVLLNRIDNAIDKQRIEFKEEIASIRADIKEEIASVRADIKEEIDKLRIEFKEEIASVREEIASIRADIKELQSTVNNLGQRVARVEALLIKDLAELAIDPTQVASESPGVEAGVAEPGPENS